MSSRPFATYLSHSWRASDLALNLRLWELLAPQCSLLVDRKPSAGHQPPWYINRIEEYIRRSDLFVGVLSYRDEPTAGDGPDGRTRCSRHALFEIRLAERARKPRMIVYDERTQFTPGTEASDYVQYVSFSLADFEQGRDNIARRIIHWLQSVTSDFRPRSLDPQRASHILLPSSSTNPELVACIEAALRDAEFQSIVAIRPVSTEMELLGQLAASGLLVADVGDGSVSDVYAMAHALFLPTIRLVRSLPDREPPLLPWYLAGHPEGYQKDLVSYDKLDSLPLEIKVRATAMRDSRRAIRDHEEGRRFLEGKDIAIPHRVFVSHSLKGSDRILVDRVVAAFKAVGIESWEYGDKNDAGVLWKRELEQQLAVATHAVLLVANGYEASRACDLEFTALYTRLAPSRIFPFLVAGRTLPLVRLDEHHHRALSSSPEVAAAEVAKRVQTALSEEPVP